MNCSRVTLIISLLNTVILTLGGVVSAGAGQSAAIVVDPGRFATIEQAAVAEEQVNWWDDDHSDDAACTQCFAALELRRFLALCLGIPEAEIVLLKPGAIPEQGMVYLIGSGFADKLGKAADDTSVPEPPESFHIRAVVEAQRTMTVIRGRDRVGALYGTYAYLERLGVRFFGLGEQGTVLPQAPVKLPGELDIVESPQYLTRGYWAWENRGNPDFFAWMARNRMNYWCVAPGQNDHLLKKLGLRLTGGHHNMQFLCINPKGEYPYQHPGLAGSAGKPVDPYAVSPEKAGDADHDGKLSYFEAHPEWYCLRDGKRSPHIEPEFGDNFCISNADARRELIKNMIQLCIDGPFQHTELINFWMLDVGYWCACDACQALGTYTDRLLKLIDEMLRGFAEARQTGRLPREMQVVTLAYHETLPPPTRPLPADFDYDHCTLTFFPIERCYVHPLADPKCTEINADVAKQYEGWTQTPGRHYTGTIFIGEYYNVSSFKSLPVVLSGIMAADIPWYYQTGARHFHYLHTLTDRWGTWTLNQYLMARLLWDTRVDVNALFDEYFTSYYPTTGPTMRRFYADLELATSNSKVFKHFVRTSAGHYDLRSRLIDPKAEIFPLDHLHAEVHHPAVNDGPDVVEIMATMAKCRQEIDEARRICTHDLERARISQDEERFAYGEAMFRFVDHLIKTAVFHRQGQAESARAEFNAVRVEAEKLRRVVVPVQHAGEHGNAANGLEASQAVDVYEFYRKLYQAPTTSPPASE